MSPRAIENLPYIGDLLKTLSDIFVTSDHIFLSIRVLFVVAF